MSRKSFAKNVFIDVAKVSHNCRASKKHRISRGDTRIAVKEGRSTKHYCIPCALKSLDADIERLDLIRKQIATQ